MHARAATEARSRGEAGLLPQDLDDFRLTGQPEAALAVRALLKACEQERGGGGGGGAAAALCAVLEAADVYRVVKGPDGRSGRRDMGRFGGAWRRWRADLKQAYKAAGGEEDRRRGRELGRRLLKLRGGGASAGELAFAA
jgi:hypothetical protein